jgi:hypothetical protein
MSQTSIPETRPSANHEHEAPSRGEPGGPTDPGRGTDGKFVKGNKGGPGNPFARQVAALRQAFLTSVTKEDIAAIAQAMLEKARAGDVAAARLVIQYSLGRPAEAVDPDRLDELEWQQWTREEVTPENHQVFTGLHAAAANALARQLVPFMQDRHMEDLQQMADEREQERREEAAEDEREAAREARRNARRAERRAAAASAAPIPRNENAPVATVVASPHARADADAAPGGAHRPEEGGQRPPVTARQRDAERVLDMLDAAVNKRPQSERRAANDFDD